MDPLHAEAPDPFHSLLRDILDHVLALLVTFGVFACLIVVLLLLQRAGFDLFSLTWLGVVPLGALVVGMFAAGGYYWASILLNVQPTKLTGPVMILIALLTQDVLYFSRYTSSLGVEHLILQDLSGFPRFVDQELRHMNFSTTIYGYKLQGSEMGLWGYLAAFFQFLALWVGGFIPYAILMDKPHCLRDRLFHRMLMKFRFPFKDERGVVEGLRGAEEASRTYFERLGSLPAGNGRIVELELSRCPKCAQEALIERIFFTREGKVRYQDVLHRSIWIRRGKTVEPEVSGLRSRSGA